MTTETIVDTNTDNTINVESNTDNSEQSQLIELQKQIDKQSQLIDKLRSMEKHNQQLAKESGAKNLEDALKNLTNGYNKDIEDWKSKYEDINSKYTQLNDTVRNDKINNALIDALKQNNVKSIDTALKIIDKSLIELVDNNVDTKVIEKIVSDLKISDAILFDTPQIPSVKDAGNNINTNSYEQELKTAKSQKDIEKILRKYNKI